MSSLTKEEYEKRKLFCKEMETLSRSELEEVYRILRRENGEFSENSNGIFFDVGTLPVSVFEALCKFVEFCKSNAKDLEIRDKIINEMGIKSDS